MLEFTQSEQGSLIHFSGDFTIFEASQVFEELKPVLLEKQDLSFDLSNIVNIDTSVIQSFMFIKCLLKNQGHSLYLLNHSQPVLDLMERLGLLSWFNDPIFISPEGENKQ